MIVVAIIGILAAIAYPSYQQYLQRAARADAQGALTSVAAVMERWFSDNNTYAGDPFAAGLHPDWSPMDEPQANRRYNLGWCTFGPEVDAGLDDPDNLAYCLQASPVAGTIVAANGALQLTSGGIRRWDRNNNNAVDAGENTWER